MSAEPTRVDADPPQIRHYADAAEGAADEIQRQRARASSMVLDSDAYGRLLTPAATAPGVPAFLMTPAAMAVLPAVAMVAPGLLPAASSVLNMVPAVLQAQESAVDLMLDTERRLREAAGEAQRDATTYDQGDEAARDRYAAVGRRVGSR
jgi:hypothetical protein